MSQYFTVAGTSVWNPATRVAQLFFQIAGAMAGVAERPHGVRDLGWDEYDIDLPTYQDFVEELARQYLTSSHPVLVPLVEGFLPTAVALLRKAGGDVPVLVEAAAGDPVTALREPGGLAAIARAHQVLAQVADLTPAISP